MPAVDATAAAQLPPLTAGGGTPGGAYGAVLAHGGAPGAVLAHGGAPGAVLAHGGAPGPLRAGTLFTPDLDLWLTLALLTAAVLYLYGWWLLRRRGDHWPVHRIIMFLGPGLGGIAAVTLSGLARYDTTLLSVHMVQHMVLSMVAPIFLALGAPVTLALRTLPRRPRRLLLAVLHSRYVRVITFPLVAYALFIANPFVLYFTSLYQLSMRNELVHGLVHAHFLMVGCLFFWPLLGVDPLPGRWPYPGRALLMLLSTPFHTVLGLTIMQSTTLLGGDWYPSLRLDWVDPWADQKLAGGILWASGEAVSVTMLGVLVVLWMRHAEREARRIDRQLDREERAARAGAVGGAA